jgi:hypothetical protein
MANMMFPDTSNYQQNAALCRAAARFRATGNSQVDYEHAPLKPFAAIREKFNSGDIYGPTRFVAGQEELRAA